MLDIQGQREQKLDLVSLELDSFYAEARVRCGVAPILREDVDSPPERLLQAVWQHQRLLRDRLKTADGRPVRILHPGFLSREGGPDFRSAVVQFGEEPARVGDVEVDLRAAGWRNHGHDRNPAFANVLLHAIWESDQPAANAPPVLLLRNVLDAPLGELSLWLGGESAQAFPEEARGKCAAALGSLEPSRLLDLLHQAARVRLRSKAAQFQARARQAGWEQSLWEGLFRALGYKHNVWPMQRLAELRPRWFDFSERLKSDGAGSALILQARLLGLSGLLPAELTRTQAATDSYLRCIWDRWWRERDVFFDCLLPRTVWHLHGLRPANHPQRRLALAGLWAMRPNLAQPLERWCSKEVPPAQLPSSLQEVLHVGPDEFWSWHWTLRSARLRYEQPLLGCTRATDLAVNVIIPWLWSRAVEGGNCSMQTRLEERYLCWPPAQDNSVLRLARDRLLGSNSPRLLPDAAAQQGLTQLVRDFCDHSNAVCVACKLPRTVLEFQQS
jgi:hypothetical protein